MSAHDPIAVALPDSYDTPTRERAVFRTELRSVTSHPTGGTLWGIVSESPSGQWSWRAYWYPPEPLDTDHHAHLLTPEYANDAASMAEAETACRAVLDRALIDGPPATYPVCP